MNFPGPHECAERSQRRDELADLNTMVGDRLDAMSDDELLAVLKTHNAFAHRRFSQGGRTAVPRLTLLRAVYHSG